MADYSVKPADLADIDDRFACAGLAVAHAETMHSARMGQHTPCARRSGEPAFLGLIDTGIAFWNPAFRHNGKPLVQSVAYLDMSTVPTPPADILGIDRLPAIPAEDMPRFLGARFPQSVFAPYKGGRRWWDPAALPMAQRCWT